METFVDIYLVEINGVPMETIKSISITSTNTKTGVKTMNAGRVVIGYTQGVREYTGKISAYRQMASPEQDWHAWARDKIAKLLAFQMNEGGQKISLVDVVLNSVDEKADEGGEIMWDMDITFRNRLED